MVKKENKIFRKMTIAVGMGRMQQKQTNHLFRLFSSAGNLCKGFGPRPGPT